MSLLTAGSYRITQFDTYYRDDGVEFNELCIPDKLYRVVKCKYVDDIIGKGVLRFGNLALYRAWENEVLGDADDGIGMYTMSGHEYTTSSTNHIYALCTSLDSVSHDRLEVIAKSNSYDCIITIHNPSELINRLNAELRENHNRLHLHCGGINYNRGDEVDKAQLSGQSFNHNVFQKNASFSEDNEYRLALVDHDNDSQEYVEVSIGDCSDILTCDRLV